MDEVQSLKNMIESCFTYGGAEVGSYNYKTYLVEYIDRLGIEVFDKVYNEHHEYLKKNAFVVSNVFTDHEGLTYNSLIIK